MSRQRSRATPLLPLGLSLLLLAAAACRSEGLLSRATPVPGAAATAARAAATPIPTPERQPTASAPLPSPQLGAAPSPLPIQPPEGQPDRQKEAVVASIGRALAERNVAALQVLMLDRVAVAVEESGGQNMPREEAGAWLAEHLGPGIKVEAWRDVEHYGLLEVITASWPQRPPLASGRITFNLHRFNSQGQQDTVRGAWKIDVIIAE